MSSPQCHFFTGENEFLLNQEYKRWCREFKDKHGEENLNQIRAKNLTFSNFKDAISTTPFIAERRLVLIDGMPEFKKEEIEEIDKYLHPQVILLIVEAKPDKRTAVTKAWLKLCKVQQFDALDPYAQEKWLEKYFLEAGGKAIDSESKKYLIKSLNGNQMLLAQELNKLACFKPDETICLEDVKQLLLLPNEEFNWEFIQILSSGNRKEIIAYCSQLVERGENPSRIWNMMIWFVNSVCLIWSCLQSGFNSPVQIAQNCSVKPGSARTLLPYVKKLSQPDILQLVKLIADLETDLKTGKFRSGTDSAKEMEAILDRCLIALT